MKIINSILIFAITTSLMAAPKEVEQNFKDVFENIILKNYEGYSTIEDNICNIDIKVSDKENLYVSLGELLPKKILSTKIVDKNKRVKFLHGNGYFIDEADELVFKSGAYQLIFDENTNDEGNVSIIRNFLREGIVVKKGRSHKLDFSRDSTFETSPFSVSLESVSKADIPELLVKLNSVINYCTNEYNLKLGSEKYTEKLCNIIFRSRSYKDLDTDTTVVSDFKETFKEYQESGLYNNKHFYKYDTCTQTAKGNRGLTLIKSLSIFPSKQSVELVKFLVEDVKVDTKTRSFRNRVSSKETDLFFAKYRLKEYALQVEKNKKFGLDEPAYEIAKESITTIVQLLSK